MTDTAAAPRRFETFDAFWRHYLREHANPRTRAWHAFGTSLGIAIALAAVFVGPWWLVLLAPPAGYLFAWLSHVRIERNRPTTMIAPLWSFGADLRMVWLMATGRLGDELRRAGVPPARG